MGGSTYSRRKKKVEPSKRDPNIVNASKFFRGVIPEDPTWATEKIRHLYDIKQIPIDKLYATRNKFQINRVEQEQTAHNKMSDYEPITAIKKDKRYIVVTGAERVIALASRGYKRIKARVIDMDR